MVLGGKNSKDQKGASRDRAAWILVVMCAGSAAGTAEAAVASEAIFADDSNGSYSWQTMCKGGSDVNKVKEEPALN